MTTLLEGDVILDPGLPAAVAPEPHEIVVRGDGSVRAAHALEDEVTRRPGVETSEAVVRIVDGPRLSGATVAALLRSHRRLHAAGGDLLVIAEDPELHHSLRCAGLDVSTG